MTQIYLCDDEESYRTLLRAVFNEEQGMEVVGEGCDGQVCLHEAADASPDLVLLDINMPRMDGLEALPKLRELAPETDVIVLTSSDAPEHEREALALGAAGLIQKPRNVFDLPRLIRATLTAAPARNRPRPAQ